MLIQLPFIADVKGLLEVIKTTRYHHLMRKVCWERPG